MSDHPKEERVAVRMAQVAGARRERSEQGVYRSERSARASRARAARSWGLAYKGFLSTEPPSKFASDARVSLQKNVICTCVPYV